MDVTGAPRCSEMDEVSRRASPYTFVGRHRDAKGHEVPVEVNTTCFVAEDGEYSLSVARDISRRMAVVVDLNKREKPLSFALNVATDGLWDWGVQTGKVFFSPQLMGGQTDLQTTPARGDRGLVHAGPGCVCLVAGAWP